MQQTTMIYSVWHESAQSFSSMAFFQYGKLVLRSNYRQLLSQSEKQAIDSIRIDWQSSNQLGSYHSLGFVFTSDFYITQQVMSAFFKTVPTLGIEVSAISRIHDYTDLPQLIAPMPEEVMLVSFLDEDLRGVQDEGQDLYDLSDGLERTLSRLYFQHNYREHLIQYFATTTEDAILLSAFQLHQLYNRYFVLYDPDQYESSSESEEDQDISNLLSDPDQHGFIGDGHCSICLERFTQPQQLQCRHVFCSVCIQQSLLQSGLICPLCRQNA